MRQKTSRRSKVTDRLAPPWKAVRLAAVGTPADALILPLATYATRNGIAPSEIDEAVLARMVEIARADELKHPLLIGTNARRAVTTLRDIRPDLGLAPLPMLGRATPRQDQWDELDPALRDEITAFIAELKRSATSNVAARNKILRALVAAEEAEVEIETLDELFDEHGLKAVMSCKRLFGEEGKQHESRSDVFELARRHALWTGDVDRYAYIQDLISDKAALPTVRSPVSPGDLLAVGVLMRDGVGERLVAHTAAVVEAFIADPTCDNLDNAQAAILARLTIAHTLFRKVAVRVAFEGPLRRTASGSRPTLVVPGAEPKPIEKTVSAGTVDLLDRFFETHRRAFGAPALLHAHPDGGPKAACTLSEAVRRMGRNVDIEGLEVSQPAADGTSVRDTEPGLELSPTILRTYMVARLVEHMQKDGGEVDVTRLKDHLGIDQHVNFRSRFGVLLKSGVFEQLARSARLG